MSLTFFQYITISYLLLFPVILNLFNWNNALVSAVFGGVFVFFQAITWGQKLARSRNPLFQFLFGLLFFLLLLITLGTLVYYAWSFTAPAMTLVFVLLPLSGSLLLRGEFKPEQTQFELLSFDLNKIRSHWPQLILAGVYLMIAFALFWQVLSHATTEAITSPWDVLPQTFWIYYFILTALFFLNLWKSRSVYLGYILSFIHIFLSLSIAVILHPLGYGFDPFIHQAAEEAILQNGFILPKTFYYIGQYVTTIGLHTLLGIPLRLGSTFLVPFLSALSLPLFWFEFVRSGADKKQLFSKPAVLSSVFLLIPFAAFVSTTPQALANLLFIWIVLGSFPLLQNAQNPLPLWFLWLMGLAATLIHPLAGISSLILLFLITYELFRDKIGIPGWMHRIIYLVVFVLGALCSSFLFIINGLISSQFTTRFRSLSELNIGDIFTWLPLRAFPAEAQFRSMFLEFAYFVQENIWWMLTLVILIMIYWLAVRNKFSYLRVYVFAGLIFWGNAVILSVFIDFPELIQYESLSYASRMFQTAYWALLPLIALAVIWIHKKTENKPDFARWMFVIFLSWIITGVLFASYPRNNRYELGRQYSVSASDIKTVKKIGAKKSNFVVLANQSVSAAAIHEYGFKTYFETDNGQTIFYYPVPTSSPLYGMYLNMVYDRPSRANAQAAADLTGVDYVYFVLNDYWDNASTIREQAKLEADEWVQIDEGKTIIFTYRF
jgi:hypothetical protein